MIKSYPSDSSILTVLSKLLPNTVAPFVNSKPCAKCGNIPLAGTSLLQKIRHIQLVSMKEVFLDKITWPTRKCLLCGLFA